MICFNFDYKTSTQHCTDFALMCAFYSSFFTSYNLQNLAYRLCFPFSAVDLYTQHYNTPTCWHPFHTKTNYLSGQGVKVPVQIVSRLGRHLWNRVRREITIVSLRPSTGCRILGTGRGRMRPSTVPANSRSRRRGGSTTHSCCCFVNHWLLWGLSLCPVPCARSEWPADYAYTLISLNY